MRTLSQELTERGFVHQFSGESLEIILDNEKRVFYLGVDPTATSLTIGNLAAYMLARHLADAGHTPLLLVGGGTGMIGDPGGKQNERTLLDTDTLQKNIAGITAQVEHILGVQVTVVNNADWLSSLNLIEFLRDVGKHFTVNAMIKKDIVKTRLDAESPLSYTEFTYSLLQAYDFAHLHKEYTCTLQIAGSDQWTNILAGVEYVRKTRGEEVFGLTNPIIVNPVTGKKFGKSEQGALWLDPKQTSPYTLYQYLLNIDDVAVEQLLKIYTLRSLEDITQIVNESAQKPGARIAQKTLASDVVAFVHGADIAKNVVLVSGVLFGEGDIQNLDSEAQQLLSVEAPTYTVRAGELVVDVLMHTGLASSKRDARTLIENRSVFLGQESVSDDTAVIAITTPTILRKGKKHLVVLLP